MRRHNSHWPLAALGIAVIGACVYLIANGKGDWVLGAFILLLIFIGG